MPMKTAPLLALALLLPGCVRDGARYPSLAPRAVEKLGFAEPEVPVVEAKPDAALDARIAAWQATLAKLTQSFDADAAKAQSAADRARGKPAGSDAWLDAQSALAALDDWRAQSSALLTDIDEAATDRAGALAPDYPALTALRARVDAEGARQGTTITRLQAALPAA